MEGIRARIRSDGDKHGIWALTHITACKCRDPTCDFCKQEIDEFLTDVLLFYITIDPDYNPEYAVHAGPLQLDHVTNLRSEANVRATLRKSRKNEPGTTCNEENLICIFQYRSASRHGSLGRPGLLHCSTANGELACIV